MIAGGALFPHKSLETRGFQPLRRLANRPAPANIDLPMASIRPLLAFLALGTSLFAADAPAAGTLTAADVIAKAQAAMVKNPSALKSIKSLHLEAKITDAEGKGAGSLIVQVATPFKRREFAYNANHSTETITCANGLEGWTKSSELVTGGRSQLGVMRYEAVSTLKDMSIDELSFFGAPESGVGKVEYKGESEVNGTKVQSVEYSYRSGFKVLRHFDAKDFHLVASDMVGAGGKVQRQVVDDVTWVESVAFTKKETVLVDGKKVRQVEYTQVVVNHEVPDAAFAFPQR